MAGSAPARRPVLQSESKFALNRIATCFKKANDVKFVAPPGARYRVYTKDDGIYVMSGLIVTIR